MLEEHSTANVNVGMRCIKYMIFTINFMFMLTGALLIVVGITINALYDEFSHFLYEHFSAPPSMLVSIGILILLVAMFGCIGAVKESTAWINMYGILLFFIFVLQIVAALFAYSLQGQIRDMLLKTMNESLYEYETDEYISDTVDLLQESLQCCGVHSPTDWDGLLTKGSAETEQSVLVPKSCCDTFNEKGDCERVYQEGCYPRLRFLVSQGTMLISTGATAVALVQILGVICAFMLAKSIRQAKSIREARRWQLQQPFVSLTEPYYPAYQEVPAADEVNKEKLYQPA